MSAVLLLTVPPRAQPFVKVGGHVPPVPHGVGATARNDGINCYTTASVLRSGDESPTWWHCPGSVGAIHQWVCPLLPGQVPKHQQQPGVQSHWPQDGAGFSQYCPRRKWAMGMLSVICLRFCELHIYFCCDSAMSRQLILESVVLCFQGNLVQLK